MSQPLSEPQLEAEAEALLDDIFSRLEEPLPSRCLPPAGQPLAVRRPVPESGAMVVLACDPAPVVRVSPPPADPERILTAAFVDDSTQRSTPWWLWLGLGTLVMWGTWQGRQQWQAAQTPSLPEPTHQEFIAYLERALDQIPEKVSPPPTPNPKPAAMVALPPPPPVTVMPIPAAPVITAPVSSPTPLPAVPTPSRPPVTLIGLLQMGANSLALFQLGDTTQQVSVGSQVGQSGWQVKEVREQEVVLARAGQNRTLAVGQALPD